MKPYNYYPIGSACYNMNYGYDEGYNQRVLDEIREKYRRGELVGNQNDSYFFPHRNCCGRNTNPQGYNTIPINTPVAFDQRNLNRIEDRTRNILSRNTIYDYQDMSNIDFRKTNITADDIIRKYNRDFIREQNEPVSQKDPFDNEINRIMARPPPEHTSINKEGNINNFNNNLNDLNNPFKFSTNENISTIKEQQIGFNTHSPSEVIEEKKVKDEDRFLVPDSVRMKSIESTLPVHPNLNINQNGEALTISNNQSPIIENQSPTEQKTIEQKTIDQNTIQQNITQQNTGHQNVIPQSLEQPKKPDLLQDEKEKKPQINLPEMVDPVPVPKYKYISSLKEIEKFSKDEQIKRLFHNNLMLYQELTDKIKENEYLKKNISQSKDEAQNDEFKNYLIKENERLNSENRQNEKIIDHLIEFYNSKYGDVLVFNDLKQNIDSIQDIISGLDSAQREKQKILQEAAIQQEKKPKKKKRSKSKPKSSSLKLFNKIAPKKEEIDKQNRTNKSLKIENEEKEEEEEIAPILTKKKKLTKRKKSAQSRRTIEPNENRYYEYYNENTRTKPCYACLFGNNNYTKGYSPLLCSPHSRQFEK